MIIIWFTVLKMPNPFGDNWQTLVSSEYYKMDEENKRHYHAAMATFYRKQVKQAVNPRKAGQAPPATDDQIRGLRELLRFHGRQARRLREREIRPNKKDYYSLEEEEDRVLIKPTYDAVERIPHTTKEMYDKYTREQKIKYWGRLTNQLRAEYGRKHPKAMLPHRMRHRMEAYPNYTPPFEGDESNQTEFKDTYKHRDVSEYYDFTDEEKRKYHHRMRDRDSGKSRNFHHKMVKRITESNINLPTYPTPEAEREAEEE